MNSLFKRIRADVSVFALLVSFSFPLCAAETVVLDANGVANLRIQTALAEARTFEETVFALGRVEALPDRVAAVSSRVSGRVVTLAARPGEVVAAGAEVARVESRQPGNPPPQVGLVAPLGGVVTRLDIRLGDPVEPDRALLEITDLSEVLAVARVPEAEVGRISPDAVARLRFAAVPDRIFEGRLVRFGTAVDAAGGTLDAVFRLANPDGRLLPGMRAEFAIVVASRDEVLSVPREAVQGAPERRHVYVKNFELPHAFDRAPVVTGASNDRFVEIVSGLFPADLVVTTGAYSLGFAGGASGISLKEALDAAHGHEHAADGSELTEASGAAASASEANGAGHAHSHGTARPWQVLSGVLFVALLGVAFGRKSNPGT